MPNHHSIHIEYTETAKLSFNDLANHLRLNNIEPRPVLTKVINYFEQKVNIFPISCPLCQDLVNLGCTKYRECNTANGYRIIYSVNDAKQQISVHLILSQKQDIPSLLYNRTILF